nr:MAG TPA_asm: hypothetical protein [Bacteriophage sp.]
MPKSILIFIPSSPYFNKYIKKYRSYYYYFFYTP